MPKTRAAVPRPGMLPPRTSNQWVVGEIEAPILVTSPGRRLRTPSIIVAFDPDHYQVIGVGVAFTPREPEYVSRVLVSLLLDPPEFPEHDFAVPPVIYTGFQSAKLAKHLRRCALQLGISLRAHPQSGSRAAARMKHLLQDFKYKAWDTAAFKNIFPPKVKSGPRSVAHLTYDELFMGIRAI